MATLTQARNPGEAILSEEPGYRSREQLLIASGQTFGANVLLGVRALGSGAVDVTQSFVGTGNGILTPANPAYSSKARDGNYKITFIAATTNAGKFRVEDPSGREIGMGDVGVAFNKEIKFTIADGATDFVVGDEFTLTLAANSDDFEYGAYDPAATDGFEVPVAYAIYPASWATPGTKPRITGMVRACELNGNCIAWPAGLTAPQKADAIQALEAKGIILRF